MSRTTRRTAGTDTPHRSCRLRTVALLLAGALTIPGVAVAAEPETPPAEETKAEAGSEAGGDTGSDNPSDEVFIPTEEISEDFAVAFPVDI